MHEHHLFLDGCGVRCGEEDGCGFWAEDDLLDLVRDGLCRRSSNAEPRFTPRLLELAKQLPGLLRADWESTNHFELTCQTKEASEKNNGYWFLDNDDLGEVAEKPDFEGESGKRVGLLLDIAAEVSRIVYGEEPCDES